ncbi:hypothetical protein BD626DRAFT_450521 [Schizophyllum amplum]|uniref:BTB domain-containing protein n=1 Tax=Schizophyllum amplum TaxID=97359 RepID=A0A550CTR0_9AGAR|nr:hypothetical protein BD626DRAFT_450521 [Auriculariopsis ampla]
MSDPARISSPLSSSPGRSVPISRPGWPWSTNLYGNRRSSQSSLLSTSSTPVSALAPPSWDNRSSVIPGSSGTLPASVWRPGTVTRAASAARMSTMEENTRQWTFMGFEWMVKDVQKLCDVIEGVDVDAATADEHEDFDILKQSPVLDSRFKLEIARTPVSEGDEIQKPTLSLYITLLTFDFAHPDYEMCATMMTAIKSVDDRVGGPRPNWVWEHWHHDWVFRRESEVWECPLPPLSLLLQNPAVRDKDSLVISLEIHCPVSVFPQHPSGYYVPRDLLEGIEASLDNPNTGDVRFVCLERFNETQHGSPVPDAHDMSMSDSSSSHSSLPHTLTARKRVIYAHSDILTRRSEYFATMLSSSFAENPILSPGERKTYTIVVEEADFETIYWLLKYCYANWLLLKEHDDPRAAVNNIGTGWSARWLTTRGGEWDWKMYGHAAGDESVAEGSVTSGDTHPTEDSGPSKARMASVVPPAVPNMRTSTTSTSTARPPPSSAAKPQTTPGRPPPASAARRAASHGTPTMPIDRGKPVSPMPLTMPPSNYVAGAHYPLSPRAQRSAPVASPDPHAHPTPAPPPASALSMYQVAHRYAMPTLAGLAQEHMMNTLTPRSSFALLLATAVWEELHAFVQDYVVEKWDEVSASEEFEECCREVAAGEWGEDGGKTMMALFRRLRAPAH